MSICDANFLVSAYVSNFHFLAKQSTICDLFQALIESGFVNWIHILNLKKRHIWIKDQSAGLQETATDIPVEGKSTQSEEAKPSTVSGSKWNPWYWPFFFMCNKWNALSWLYFFYQNLMRTHIPRWTLSCTYALLAVFVK